jgi:hypothetical protein
MKEFEPRQVWQHDETPSGGALIEINCLLTPVSRKTSYWLGIKKTNHARSNFLAEGNYHLGFCSPENPGPASRPKFSLAPGQLAR